MQTICVIVSINSTYCWLSIKIVCTGLMLCYFVVIDTVESIINECLIRHVEITKFFYVLVNVSPKWVFVLLLMRLF